MTSPNTHTIWTVCCPGFILIMYISEWGEGVATLGDELCEPDAAIRAKSSGPYGVHKCNVQMPYALCP